MNRIIRTTPRLHPLLAAAAVSVVIVSAAGVGVMTGVLPGSHAVANGAPTALVMPAPVAAPVAPQVATPPAPAVSAQAAPAPKPAARPRVAKAPTRERAYDDEEPIRRTATLPAVSTNAPRNTPYDPNSYGGYGNAQGAPQGGYGGAQGGPQGPYGSAPVQVGQAPTNLPAIPPPVAKPVCANCGVVEAVVENTKPGDGSGVGIAGGALGGAVIGKQFGKGRGADALAILGAIGGAFAGHQVEKSVRSTKVYEVRVRMEDGSTRSVTQSSAPTWRNGDRVRIDGDSISLANT